ncbi:hypothetical protein M9Y10_013975 [Tritrichomonas musculus]|uniref:Myb-like DNA-binding domain containing protein n=1 Tax=Tritrichomonas musculus TaxID=1915356 RepID=A0ABR2KY80_9EUKA
MENIQKSAKNTANEKHPLFSRKPFTPEEDAQLVELVSSQQFPNWKTIASVIKGRTARQCRERWSEYLNPSIKFEPWTTSEDTLLVQMVQLYGNKWTFISKMFNGRTGNDVKNRWYSHLKGVVYTDINGNLQILRNENGEIMSNKKKRKRNIVSVNQNAYLFLEQKQKKQMAIVNTPQVRTFVHAKNPKCVCLNQL